MGLNTGSLASRGRRQGISIHFTGGLSSLFRESECLNGEEWTYLSTMSNVLQGTHEYHFLHASSGQFNRGPNAFDFFSSQGLLLVLPINYLNWRIRSGQEAFTCLAQWEGILWGRYLENLVQIAYGYYLMFTFLASFTVCSAKLQWTRCTVQLPHWSLYSHLIQTLVHTNHPDRSIRYKLFLKPTRYRCHLRLGKPLPGFSSFLGTLRWNFSVYWDEGFLGDVCPACPTAQGRQGEAGCCPGDFQQKCTLVMTRFQMRVLGEIPTRKWLPKRA